MDDPARIAPAPDWRASIANRWPQRWGWPPRPAIVAGLAAIAVVIGALAAVFLVEGPNAPVALSLPRAVTDEAAPDAAVAGLPGAASVGSGTSATGSVAPPAGGAAPTGGASDVASQPLVVVHVAGGVASPGVYSLAEGARVADAIAAAGGGHPEADLDVLNLATRLADGDRVYVPRRGESAAAGLTPGVASSQPDRSGSAPPVPSKVNLNAASAADLDLLPGIGPATAQAIVDYRDGNGPFGSVDELLEVRGIGPAKLEALRNRVAV